MPTKFKCYHCRQWEDMKHVKHDSEIDEDGDKIAVKVCRACAAEPPRKLIDLPIREIGFGKVSRVLSRREIRARNEDLEDLEGQQYEF